MNIKNLILFISIVTLVSCKSSHFIHKNGTKKIELIIPNNEIVLGDSISTTYLKLKLTNINPKDLIVIGVGVSITSNKKLNNNDEYMYLVLKTRDDYYKEHKFYDLRVTYSDNGEKRHHTFKIPLTRKNK